MNTDVLLAKIGEMIEPLKQDMREVKQEVSTLSQDIGSLKQNAQSLKQGQERIEQRLEQSIKDSGDFFHKTWEKMETAEKRVTRFKEAANNPRRN